MTTSGSSQETIKLRLGTATPGGGFPVYGAAFIAAVQEGDPGLAIEAINTKGSTENVPMLEEKRLDIALVQGEVVHEVLTGVGRAPANLKIIAAMYSTPGMFVVRADSPYRSIADLKGKPVAFGAAGSGLVILARYVLDGLGLDQNKDFQAIYLERAGDGPAMVMDGRAAALWGGGSGWPGFTTVAKGEKGARFIVPDKAEITRILHKHTFLKPLTLAAGMFPGQDKAIELRGFLELGDVASRSRRRRGVSVGEGGAQGRGGDCQNAAPGCRDHRKQHGDRRSHAGYATSRRAALSARGGVAQIDAPGTAVPNALRLLGGDHHVGARRCGQPELAAGLLAQDVDGLAHALHLVVPEGPAVAGGLALQLRAQPVDRALAARRRQRAVGTHLARAGDHARRSACSRVRGCRSSMMVPNGTRGSARLDLAVSSVEGGSGRTCAMRSSAAAA